LVAVLRRGPPAPVRIGKPVPLSSQERQQVLLEIQRALGEGVPLAESRVKS